MRNKSLAGIILVILAFFLTSCASEKETVTISDLEPALGTTEAAPTTDSTCGIETQTTEPETEESSSAAETEVPETPPETEPPLLDNWVTDYREIYLSEDGMFELGSEKNVIVFLIDRFDTRYYDTLLSNDPTVTSLLDDFTLFRDNISLYSRTYPGMTTMLTGIDTAFDETQEEYFKRAYANSEFLKDLRANGFDIKLYLQSYYCYFAKAAMYGNIYNAKEEGSEGKKYEINDGSFGETLRSSGLSVGDGKKNFIFYHLNGCHDPGTLTADGRPGENTSVYDCLKGCFTIIHEYIGELKRLGLYDDATIIITGDHPAALDDTKIPYSMRLTGVLVKRPGDSFPLQISEAQVSQENFIPTIAEFSGIRTEKDYGDTYFDIDPAEKRVRIHKFERSGAPEGCYITYMQIVGKGTDFDHWSVLKEEFIKDIYR